MKTAKTDDLRTARRSACADESRRHVEARTRHLSPSERAEDLREFNLRLAEIVDAGRFAK